MDQLLSNISGGTGNVRGYGADIPAPKADSKEVREKRIRLFMQPASGDKKPCMTGKMCLDGKQMYVGLWKNKSKYSEDFYYSGLFHADGDRNNRLGIIRIYMSKYYTKGGKAPVMYGRVYKDQKIYKVLFWPKEGKKGAFLTGFIK
jgi:hypothetical protein